MSPLKNALIAQFSGGFIAAAAAQIIYPQLFSFPAGFALVQGLFAALVSHKLDAPRWWLPIHLCFLPLALAASRLDIPPAAWLGGFLLLFLLFWRTDRGQVPLFMTNARTAMAVRALLPQEAFRCVDLGCGTGSLLRHLAAARPDASFFGVEHAPLPFLLAWVRSLPHANMTIRYGNFWHENLGHYQIIYAFLSPVPMTELWKKCCAEMEVGSLLVSNSFAIPGVAETSVVDVPDRRRTRLFCYRRDARKQEYDKNPFSPTADIRPGQ